MAKGEAQVTDIILQRIDRLEDRVNEKLDRIENQTTRTNGRVSVLEKKAEELEQFKTSIDKRIIIIEEDNKVSRAIKYETGVMNKARLDSQRWWFKLFIDNFDRIIMVVIVIYLVLQRTGIIV